MPAHPPSRHFPAGKSPARTTRVAALSSTDLHRLAATTILDVTDRLQPRDYTIAALLDEHHTLTTDQLTAVLFASPITCRHRLHLLRRLAFIDRFIRARPAPPHPVCWVPGLLSARYMALSREDSPPTGRAVRDRQDRICASPMLDPVLEVNQFFVSLLGHARQHPGTAVTRWWSERTIAAVLGHRVKPDGHGVWADGSRETGFYLEQDRGTEPIGRLMDKLAGYRRLRGDGGPPYPILFVLPSPIREHNLHRRLAEQPEPLLTIATTSPEFGPDPAGPVWRLAGNGGHRHPLADLPSDHGEPGPFTPGPVRPEHDPLRRLR